VGVVAFTKKAQAECFTGHGVALLEPLRVFPRLVKPRIYVVLTGELPLAIGGFLYNRATGALLYNSLTGAPLYA
jgi:hypothetical protein